MQKVQKERSHKNSKSECVLKKVDLTWHLTITALQVPLQVQLQVRQVAHLMVAEVQVTITHPVEQQEVMGL